MPRLTNLWVFAIHNPNPESTKEMPKETSFFVLKTNFGAIGRWGPEISQTLFAGYLIQLQRLDV